MGFLGIEPTILRFLTDALVLAAIRTSEIFSTRVKHLPPPPSAHTPSKPGMLPVYINKEDENKIFFYIFSLQYMYTTVN